MYHWNGGQVGPRGARSERLHWAGAAVTQTDARPEGRTRVDTSLVLVQPDGKQREIPLKGETCVIGRQVDCQIRIPSDSVSRRHCELQRTGDAVVARDLGSANGTYVNRKPIREVELHAGDVIVVGPAVFVFRVAGQPDAIDSAKVLASAAEAPKPQPAAPPSRPAAATPAGIKPLLMDEVDRAAKPAPAKKKADEDLDLGELGAEPDLDDSSAFDFDFTDDKDAPKL